MSQASGGQIWEALRGLPARTERALKPRRIYIEKGERLEFRYWHPAVLRTADDYYVRIDEKDFYENFKLVGKVFEEVRLNNRNKTKEILEFKLYNEVKK